MSISQAISRRRYLDYLVKQYEKGILDSEKVELLIREGRIKLDVAQQKLTPLSRKEKLWEEMMDPYIQYGGYYGQHPENITKAEWMPESVLKHTPEFVNWINSMLYGFFPNRIEYKKFNLYKAQAFRWLQDDDNLSSYHTEDAKREYINREYDRSDENSLYWVDKYGELKEGDISSGFIKYKAKEHHAIICYLFDCGYNVIGGKGRQIGWTSIMGLLTIKKMIFQANYYIKFVTEDKDTGEEIFTDKIKYPFGAIPKWMQPKVKSDSGTRFWLSDKAKKGEKGYPNSRIDVIAPKITAINGGSPQLALIDEIGTIPILGAMLNEARPTMFWNNPYTGKYELKRQIFMWGCLTAGNRVWNNNGDLVNIEDLIPEEGILGYDGNGISKENITYWQPPTEKFCYKITTNTGRSIECSEDHPILWSRKNFGIAPRPQRKYIKQIKFVKAKDIKVGDQLAIIEEIPIYGNKNMWEPRFIGWLIGDGTYGIDHSPRMSTCDPEIYKYIETTFNANIKVSRKTKMGKIYKEILIKDICVKLRELGIYGQTKLNKRLPIKIHSYSKKDICELLGGIFDTDGCVHYTHNKIKYIDLTCFSFELLNEIQLLMQKLGIHVNIKRIKAHSETNPKDKNDWYVLYITGKNIITFFENISFAVKYKQERLNIVVDYIKTKNYKLSKIIKGLRFERVIKIIPTGLKPVYNLTTDTTHTYIANGIVTHNTGGNTSAGRGEYEKEWYRILGLWEAKQYDNGFVPLFFSWHTRCDRHEYEREKAWYYGPRAMKEEIDLETSKTQFHQHYPSNFKDMFLTTASTLVSREIIEGGLDRCRNLIPRMQPTYGYFEPVFNEMDPMPPESDVPFRIIDARFVPLNDDDDFNKASVCIFQKPEAGWDYRYYQGTDPIAVETGHSKFSSSIWDEYRKTISAVMNYRKQHDHKYTFLQSLLLGLYYDTSTGIKTGTKELVEANIGTNYVDYKEIKGFFSSLVFNSQLPSKVAGGARLIGVDNKSTRANAIIDYMTELLRNYHDRLYIYTIFEQLTTFVQSLSQKSGKEVWGPMNKLMHFDDVLYSCTYAYICRLAHPNLYPTQKVPIAGKTKIRYKLQRNADWSIERKPVKVPVFETFKEQVALENEDLNQ